MASAATHQNRCRIWVRLSLIAALSPLGGRPAAAAPQPDWPVRLEGQLLDSKERLLDGLGVERGKPPSPAQHQRLIGLLDEIGYRVEARRAAGGRLVLKLSPHPVVRRIYIKGNNWPLMPLFEDELLRRLRFRPGQRLRDGPELARLITRQEERMRRFLAREGFFEGSLRIRCRGKTSRWGGCRPLPVDTRGRVDIQVRIYKGRSYKLGRVKVVRSRRATAGTGEGELASDLATSAPAMQDEEIAKHFRHRILFYRRGFNTEVFKADLERLKRRYQRLGHPGVRIKDSFTVDPCSPSDRAVRIKLKVDPRKKITVVFRGNDSIKDRVLDRALTIYDSGAYDDYELAQSVQKLHKLYQAEGYLQARVRFARVRLSADHDRVTFTIHEGPRFRVARIDFVGNRRLSAGTLQKQIRTRTFPWLGYVGLGEGGYITDKQLRQDVERLTAFYRSRGFPRAKVLGEVAPHSSLFGRPGALAAAVASGVGEAGEAHVRFTITEGPQIQIYKIFFHPAPERIQLPTTAARATTRDVADHGRSVARRPSAGVASSNQPAKLSFAEEDLRDRLADAGLATGKPFTPSALKHAKEALLAFYAERGYPYAEVGSFESVNTTGTLVDLHFTLREDKQVRIGAIFIRGNFKTRDGTIRDALGFASGDLFDIRKRVTAEQNLRRLQIFNAVRIRLLELRQKPARVPVLVQVEERYDDYGAVEFAVGGSSDNLFFGSVAYTNRNLWGFGTGLELKGELGIEIRSLNARYTDPQLFGSRFSLDTSGFWRQEITERLGDITTFGTTITVSRELLRHLHGSLRYEIRRVKRQEDLNRPAGARDEFGQVDVFTTTAGAGPALVYDRRDNPLSPTRGFRLATSALWASTYLGSTNDFVKLSANGQLYVPLPFGVTFAFGVRYDHGIPLGGAVLLPKVERFFAGGDTTIRGFEEDRAFAERVSAPASPLPNATIVRVAPQGGNIRLLTNLELQFPIWKESPLLGRDLLLAGFIDNGVVLNSFESFEWEDFRHGAGFALRLVLPVGFASFEFGFPLDPSIGDPPDGWRFHFNFGFIL